MYYLSSFVIYQKMNECWAQDPDCRPSFSLLYEVLKGTIEEEQIHFNPQEWKEMEAGDKRKQAIKNRKRRQAKKKCIMQDYA